MKIAILCEYFYPDDSGSTPTDLGELASCLKNSCADIEIDVITSRHLYRPSGVNTALLPKEVWNGLTIRRLRAPKSNRPSIALRLLSGGVFSMIGLFWLLRKPAYDLLLIVTNPPANALAAWLYRNLRGVPYVYLVHDLYPDIAVALGRLNNASLLARACRSLQKRWLASAAMVVALGRCMRDHLHSRYDVPLDHIKVISSWADPITTSVFERDNRFRRANAAAGFVVLYGGNFSHYVNFDQILGAAKLLEDQDVSFVLVGDGVRRSEIVDIVEKEGLKNVRVLASVHRSDMKEVLAAADISLIPLDRRMLGLGVPSKLYSILASGRAAVAMVPPGSEVAMVLEEEQCGVNVLGDDASVLASGIVRLKQNPILREQMAQNARSALVRRFTLNHAAEQFRALFKEVLTEA
ncbi:MAG: glycosyltransferase family 4 protein [Verrucomicrobiota bacterium]